ncbi:MAG: hypothetical protein RLY23_769 [Actinomycetota bacterium]
MILWLNGAMVSNSEARISPSDHGFLVGDGVFETLRVYSGVPFAWNRHRLRLEHSAAALGLTLPSDETLRSAANDVIAMNALPDCRMRVTITGGESSLGSDQSDSTPTAVIAVGHLTEWPVTASVVTVQWTRNERGATAGLKTTSYAENVRALTFAKSQSAEEAIFANTRGELCEGTGSNVFVLQDGVLCTPPLSSGCLAGVTRAITIELADKIGIPCEERDMPLAALAGAGEAFLTSSTREIQAIGNVDGMSLASAPGPITLQLQGAWRDLLSTTLEP